MNHMDKKQTTERADPLLDEIHEIKRLRSEQFGHDVRRMAEQLQKEQKIHGARLVRRPRGKKKGS